VRLFEYARASGLMEEAGIDVILASSRHNVGYLSDYWHSVSDDYYLLWDPSVTHKTLVGLPKDEEKGPFMVPGASEMTTLERDDPWIKDRRYWGPGYYIQTWNEPDPDPGNPMDVVSETLIEKGFEAGRIAIEKRYLGLGYFERLRSRMPRAEFLDAEEVLWALRIVKSQEEIRRLREACLRTSKAWLNVMDWTEEGVTELEMSRQFAATFAELGMDSERAYCIYGPAGIDLKNGSPLPSDNPLCEGQFIRVDVQGRYEGYVSNISRVIGFGEVTTEMAKAHEQVKSIMEQLVPTLGPGVPVRDVRKAEMKLYEGTGYEAVVPYTGHGVGRVVHEPPYLTDKNPTILQPGMSVTLEPTVNFREQGDIFISLEDQFLITDDGAECLTADATLDLYLK
jgi:Xaa-Pro dipeptidase